MRKVATPSIYHFVLIVCFHILGEVLKLGEVTILDSSSLYQSEPEVYGGCKDWSMFRLV